MKSESESYIVINSGNNNEIYIGKNCHACFNILTFENNNVFKLGENSSCHGIRVTLINNKLFIGKDCLISSRIIFHADGHTVVNYESGDVLNLLDEPMVIGDHCWLGMQTTFLKGAQVPDDCVVAFGSIVTKKFDKPHCVIAGSPAKIVKENVSWSSCSPHYYYSNNLKAKYKKYK